MERIPVARNRILPGKKLSRRASLQNIPVLSPMIRRQSSAALLIRMSFEFLFKLVLFSSEKIKQNKHRRGRQESTD